MLQPGILMQDLFCGRSVRKQVQDVGDGQTGPSNNWLARQNFRVVRDAFQQIVVSHWIAVYRLRTFGTTRVMHKRLRDRT